jgi:RNA polymerase sigma-70 factor, ECF subfamily
MQSDNSDNNDNSTDEQVLREVICGETGKFKIIVERYQAYIFSIGMRFFRNEDDSYDFVQDVLLKAYNELGTFKGKASFRSWLVRIAYNYGINRIKEKKFREEDIKERASKAATPEKNHFRYETVVLLRKAIDDLPERYRICVDLYFFMGFKYNEIESITGYPVNTIKSNVLRAKQILREKLRGSIAEDYNEM